MTQNINSNSRRLIKDKVFETDEYCKRNLSFAFLIWSYLIVDHDHSSKMSDKSDKNRN